MFWVYGTCCAVRHTRCGCLSSDTACCTNRQRGWFRVGLGRGGRRQDQPARHFRDSRWSTLDSRSRRRRVIGKAEWTRGEIGAQVLYERVYERVH